MSAAGDLPTEVIIPRGATLAGIEGAYGPLKNEIACGLESCRTPHKSGFVVEFLPPGGRGAERGLIGRVCGKKAFGTDWQEASRRFAAERRITTVAELSRGLREAAEEILPQLRAALPTLRRCNAAYRAIAQHAPWLMSFCADAVRSHGGQIGVDRAGKFIPVLKLEGGGFYVSDSRALRRAEELQASLERAVEFLSRGAPPVRQVSDRIRALGDVRHAWSIIERELREAEVATRPATLARVVHAVGRITDRDGVLRVEGGALQMKSYRNWADRHGTWNEIAALE